MVANRLVFKREIDSIWSFFSLEEDEDNFPFFFFFPFFIFPFFALQ